MRELEVFFDFTCPYCYRGLQNLPQVLEDFPDVIVRWTPCEAHPRPEKVRVHSDVALRSRYIVEQLLGEKADVSSEKEISRKLYDFIMLVYDAHFEKKELIDDILLLSDLSKNVGVESARVAQLLREGAYADRPEQNNAFAWGEMAFDAVPSYRLGEATARSGSGVLVSNEEVRRLLKQ